MDRVLQTLGMDPSRPFLSVQPEPRVGSSSSQLQRMTSLSIQVKGLTVAQFPNLPLGFGLAAGLVSRLTDGTARAITGVLSALALSLWAYEEVVEGLNWFRRALGVAGVIDVVVRLRAVVRDHRDHH